MYEHLKIGSMVYAVHNKYVKKEANEGGKIQVCRVKTFQNVGGKIMPVLSVVGNSKMEVNTKQNTVYVELSKAIDAIRSK